MDKEFVGGCLFLLFPAHSSRQKSLLNLVCVTFLLLPLLYILSVSFSFSFHLFSVTVYLAFDLFLESMVHSKLFI